MKAGLTAYVPAMLDLRDAIETSHLDLDGRVVIENVVNEEEGDIEVTTAALDTSHPFERDAALIAEPTRLESVVATESLVVRRFRLTGRTAYTVLR